MRVATLKWRLFEKGKCLGVLTAEEVVSITGMKKNNISAYADTGTVYKKTYRIEKVEKTEDFSCAWEQATGVLLKKGVTASAG